MPEIAELHIGVALFFWRHGLFGGEYADVHGGIGCYAVITEPDKTVLNRLINRILIGEPKNLLTLIFQALKYQEIQSFSHVFVVVVFVSSSFLLQSVWSI